MVRYIERAIFKIAAIIVIALMVAVPVYALDAGNGQIITSEVLANDTVKVAPVERFGGAQPELEKKVVEKEPEIVEVKVVAEAPAQETQQEPAEPQAGMVSLGTFKIVHYCTGTVTATGTTPTPGRTIAVDPSVIPLGSKVYIGGKMYIAEDTGGAIKGNKIDVFVGSQSEALSLGVKSTEVFIQR